MGDVHAYVSENVCGIISVEWSWQSEAGEHPEEENYLFTKHWLWVKALKYTLSWGSMR